MAHPAARTLSDPAETEFRSHSNWHSFKGTLYGAISSAAFIGLLTTLVTRLVESFSSQPPAQLSAGGYGVMASMIAVGTVFTYLSVREWTEQASLRDAHMARKNAECMAHQQQLHLEGPAIVPAKAEECTTCRSDGKSWVQATAQAMPETQRVM